MHKISKLFILSLIAFSLCLSIFSQDLNYPTVRADSTNSGFNFFTNYIDYSLGVTGSYQTQDASGDLPEDATGVILIQYSLDGVANQGVYQRHPDSSDDFYRAGVGLQNQGGKYAIVGINDAGEWEQKINDLDVNTKLLGYTDSRIKLFDDVIDVSITDTGSWETVDLSSDVPDGATGVIILAETGSDYKFGMRHPDSTDTIFYNDVEGWVYGLCGINEAREYEVQIENVGVKQYLVGYTLSPVQFLVNWVDYSTDNTNVWVNTDVSADVPEDSTGVIIFKDPNGSGWHKGDIREDGSTNDVQAYTQVITDGIAWLMTGLSEEIFEQKVSSASTDLWLVGYTEEFVGPTGPVYWYPDHVESSSGGTNTTHTLLNNQTYGEFTSSGWIIWDYNQSVANVTRITWDITHPISHSLFRLDSSSDLLSWETIIQLQGKVGYPPTIGEHWSRYDSEISGRFRYLRLTTLGGVTSDYSVDSVWLTVQPPAINYTDATYVYPQVVVDWNWEIYGASPMGRVNYASQPTAMLGQHESGEGLFTSAYNESCLLVNADLDPDNQAVVMFDDYYNLTTVEMHFRSGGSAHVYLYMSTTGDSDDWSLVEDWTGINNGWLGSAISGTRIRYLKANSTDIQTNSFSIEAFRIQGVIHSGDIGDGDGDGGYDWTFYVFPNWLADALGIPLLAGQLLASACVLACILLPFAFYERRSFWATIIIGLVVFAFLVALGWLPTWLMLLLTLLVAGLFAFRFSNWFGGR